MTLDVPDRVTESNFDAALRQLRAAPLAARGRDDLRSRLITYLHGTFDEALERGELEQAWDDFAQTVALHEPAELSPGEIDEQVGAMAEAVLQTFEPRGDEARVLGALLVLTLTASEPAPYAQRYDEVAQWSTEVRQALPSDTERVLGLVEVFEGVTTVAPLPDPVDRLSDLYIERHQLLQGAFGGMMGLQALLSPRGRGELQSLLAARGASVSDIVTLYLRAGRPEDVRRAVSPLGSLSGRDRELVQAARNLDSERRRAESISFLASQLGRNNPDVALDLCHEGHQLYPDQAVFTQCLAEVYRHLGDDQGALDYYIATLENDPTPENYERTLVYVTRRMEQELNEEDTRRAREIHDRARSILDSFHERFPDRQPPVQSHHLFYLIGIGEFNAGHIDRAIERLETSVQSTPTRAALSQLGVISLRRGQTEQAIRQFRQALDLVDSPTGENPLMRAVVLDNLADAYNADDQADRANTLHLEALEMLRVAENDMSAQASPDIFIQRGLVLYDLGRTNDARQALNSALAAAPQRRATYGRLLSFYVGHGMVEPALEVYHQAFNNSDLDRTWKIYYSMWIVGLQRRLDTTPDQAAVQFLESVEGDDWIEQLGRYYAGDLTYDQLLTSAQTQGQRAEAFYYEAILRLAGGDLDRGRELLQQVIDTNMMGYYEYEFARLLREDLGSSSSPAPQAATSP